MQLASLTLGQDAAALPVDKVPFDMLRAMASVRQDALPTVKAVRAVTRGDAPVAASHDGRFAGAAPADILRHAATENVTGNDGVNHRVSTNVQPLPLSGSYQPDATLPVSQRLA